MELWQSDFFAYRSLILQVLASPFQIEEKNASHVVKEEKRFSKKMFAIRSRRLQRGRPLTTATNGGGTKFILLALFALVVFWVICFVVLATTSWDPKIVSTKAITTANNNDQQSLLRERSLEPHIVSRTLNVNVTSDVRGNLGPAQVVVQAHPGKDWLHDRWQAASNMHGKNIPGAHWIHLDFGKEIIPQKIILDWEAAYADEYRLEASLQHPISSSSSGTRSNSSNSDDDVWTLFDSSDPNQIPHRYVEKTGQSPGVNTKTPLHVIHAINPLQSNRPLRYLRLHIFKSAMGWGVSLWQLDVIGYKKEEVIE